MSEEITPALTAKQWEDGNQRIYFREPRERGPKAGMDDGYGVERCKDGTLAVWDDSWGLTIPAENRHALAALCLYDQPFGFTQEEVQKMRDHADNAEATYPYAEGDLDWLRSIATRIAALLPPSPLTEPNMRTSDRLLDTVHDLMVRRGKRPTRIVVGWQVWRDMEIELGAMLNPPTRIHFPDMTVTCGFHLRGIPGRVSPYLNTRHAVWYEDDEIVAVTEVPEAP